ncbi:MAG: molybdopterin cofactor-binding domain-containing protein [Tetrasphaera sp.]
MRDQLVTAFGLDKSQVRVIAPETGAGYGGKHAGDAAIEAARLAKAVGQPVRVVWTRAEEFTWAYFRPAGLIEIASGVDAQGQLTALEMVNYNSGAAGIEPLYAIPNRRITYLPADPPLRQGAYRALAATANNFARESHIDGWAHRLGEDPLAFRLRHITDPRLRAVLEAAAAAVWLGRTYTGRNTTALASLCGSDKGSYVAACAEVCVDASDRRRAGAACGGSVRVRRAHQPGQRARPGGRRRHPGAGRRALRTRALCQWPHPQPGLCGLSCPALRRHPA